MMSAAPKTMNRVPFAMSSTSQFEYTAFGTKPEKKPYPTRTAIDPTTIAATSIILIPRQFQLSVVNEVHPDYGNVTHLILSP